MARGSSRGISLVIAVCMEWLLSSGWHLHWKERAGHTFPRPRREGLCFALALEGDHKALVTQVLVPELGEVPVLLVELGVVAVIAVLNEAAPLLDTGIIVAPVEGSEVCASSEAKLETHLGVTHGVAVLFAVVSDRDRG